MSSLAWVGAYISTLVAIVWVSSVHSQTAGLIGWTGKKFMTNFRVTCIISLFSREKEWNLKWFQIFRESEKIFSRNEKWNVFFTLFEKWKWNTLRPRSKDDFSKKTLRIFEKRDSRWFLVFFWVFSPNFSGVFFRILQTKWSEDLFSLGLTSIFLSFQGYFSKILEFYIFSGFSSVFSGIRSIFLIFLYFFPEFSVFLHTRSIFPDIRSISPNFLGKFLRCLYTSSK